ncbi:hypothetical protein V8G54_001909 [Vigna mungo]|uniref:Uncharacterized protein n=1 Tax=Vigna mungo TaxID=3915 RepID=A0AAQ3P977_VIGMU
MILLSMAIALVTKINDPASIFFVANNPLPLISDLLISTAPMCSASSGSFPRNPFETQSERSKHPVLDKSSKLLHLSKYPLTLSAFPSSVAVLKHSRAEAYRLRQSKILPLHKRVFECVASSSKAWSQS